MSPLSTMRKFLPVLRAAITAKGAAANVHSAFDSGYFAALHDIQSLIETGKPSFGLWFHARRIARAQKALRAERAVK